MKVFNLILFSFLFIALSCQNGNSDNTPSYVPAGLTKLSNAELIERAKQGNMPNLQRLVFKSEEGKVIPMDSLVYFNPEEFATDSYVNEAGEVVAMVMRKVMESDFELREKLKQAITQGPDAKQVDIDCANQGNILQAVFNSDQEMRQDGNTIDSKIDHQNLETVISLIEKCGMPTLAEVDKTQMLAIWLVFQHSSNQYRKKYMPVLEEAAKSGALDQTAIAMMKDRTLKDDGEAQVYGTQVVKNNTTGEWELYTLENPEFVNKRRVEIGFEPLQEYLNRWDITFSIPQQ